MNIEQAKEEVKKFLPDYLQETGRQLNKPFHCVNPKHHPDGQPDEHPSMSYDKKHNLIHCFTCRKSYDLLGVIQIDRNCSFMDALRYACEKYGVKLDESDTGSDGQSFQETGEHGSDHDQRPRQDLTSFFSQCASGLQFASGYLAERGISQDLAKRYRLGVTKKRETAIDEDGQQHFTDWTCLVIPTSKYTYTVRNMDRNASHSNRYRHEPAGAGAVLFNLKYARQETERPVFIVEGEMDALSILEAGGQVIGLSSTSNTKKLLEELNDWKPQTPLVVALDNDDAGKTAAASLLEELKKRNVTAYQYNPYGIAKDANEALTTNPEALRSEVRRVNQNAKEAAESQALQEYQKTSAASQVDDFIRNISESAKMPHISTGFPFLDEVIGGGVYAGLYFLGARSGLGKTTLLCQIMDNMAKSGQDVIMTALEMSRYELMAKSISRLTYLEAMKDGLSAETAKSTREILDGQRYDTYSKTEMNLIQGAMNTYKEYAGHVYIVEGVGNIGVSQIAERVRKHIEITGNRPVLIVDYLQILAPADVRATDKQNTDKAVLELKRLSRDENIPVICVSSLNRDNYKDDKKNGLVTMADFKESGAIEYTADVLMALEFQKAGRDEFKAKAQELEKKKDVIPVRVRTLKVRNGREGQASNFSFSPKYNYYEETGERTTCDDQ